MTLSPRPQVAFTLPLSSSYSPSHLRYHHHFKLSFLIFPGLLVKMSLWKKEVINAKQGWATGLEILAFSVLISEIYKFWVCKDIASIIPYFTEFRTPSFVRCTVILRTIRKENSVQTKLWYAMHCELHHNFRYVKIWKKKVYFEVCLGISELRYFYKCT